jgi:asparagine synthase (glutamine-hydrolysing)
MPKLTWKDFTESEINGTDRIEAILKQIIKREIKTKHEVTISLSSGVDSTLVLALLRECYPRINIHSISVGFNDPSDETKQAAQIAKMYDCDHHEVYIDNPFRDLPKQIAIVKEPRWNLYWYHVVKSAKSISNVLFTGDGGDELFGGYTFRYKKFLSLNNGKGTWKDRAQLYLQCHERDWVPDQENLFGNKIKFNWSQILDLLEPYFNNPLPPLGQVFLADFNGKLLFDWLPTNNKLYSYFKLRAVAPMLSKELISLATHIPYKLKYNAKTNVGKLQLRRILESRKFNISSKKQGFGADLVLLWKRYGKEATGYYLDRARIIEDDWISQEWLDSALRKIKQTNDVRYINKIFSLIAFEIWYRIFVTKEMKNEAT